MLPKVRALNSCVTSVFWINFRCDVLTDNKIIFTDIYSEFDVLSKRIWRLRSVLLDVANVLTKWRCPYLWGGGKGINISSCYNIRSCYTLYYTYPSLSACLSFCPSVVILMTFIIKRMTWGKALSADQTRSVFCHFIKLWSVIQSRNWHEHTSQRQLDKRPENLCFQSIFIRVFSCMSICLCAVVSSNCLRYCGLYVHNCHRSIWIDRQTCLWNEFYNT